MDDAIGVENNLEAANASPEANDAQQQQLKEVICKEINDCFFIGQQYESKELLLEAVQAIVSKHYYSVMVNSTKITCRRATNYTPKCERGELSS